MSRSHFTDFTDQLADATQRVAAQRLRLRVCTLLSNNILQLSYVQVPRIAAFLRHKSLVALIEPVLACILPVVRIGYLAEWCCDTWLGSSFTGRRCCRVPG